MMSAVVFIFNATSTADTDQSQYSESSMLLRLLRLADMRGIMSRRPHGCGYGVSSHQVSRHPVESLAKPINHPRQITRAYRKTTENHELPTEACASLHQRTSFLPANSMTAYHSHRFQRAATYIINHPRMRGFCTNLQIEDAISKLRPK